MLNAAQLQSRLPVRGLGEPFYFYPTIESTNGQAAKLAHQGSPHGTLVAAEEQTTGRGRAGRHWFTPPQSALAFSLVLRLQGLKQEMMSGLVVLGALAVVDAIEGIGGEARIKWPNDVLLDGRKAAGVLVESSWMGDEMEYAILGIGVNVSKDSVPTDEEIEFPATCVETAVGENIDRQELLLSILERVGWWLPRLGEKRLLEAWERRLAFRDREVWVQKPDGDTRGRIQGLTAGGGLRMISGTGEVVELAEGNIRIRPVDMGSK